MISEKMQKTINNQINEELYSAYLYLSMEAYFKSLDLPGFANWMRVQTQEELIHVTKFYNFLSDRRGRIILQGIKQPPWQWESPLAAFKAAYEHEQYISGKINDLVNLAIEEKDHATNSFLKWFVDEQVEEEASVDAVAQKLKLVEKSPSALFMIDNELGQRVFTPPAAPAEGA